MKKNFCKVRREHWFSLVWVVSFLLWGNVAMAALPIQEARFSMQQHSVALSRVFHEIEKQTGYVQRQILYCNVSLTADCVVIC